MNKQFFLYSRQILIFIFLLILARFTYADGLTVGGLSVSLDGDNDGKLSNAVQVFLVLSLLSIAPGMLIVMTAFTRIIIVLAILRQALGMQQTPPNTVMLSLALFLTLFTMMPVVNQLNAVAYKPYQDGVISFEDAIERGKKPIKEFMLFQTRESDLQLMLELSNAEIPDTIEDISFIPLVPAFMLSELLTAFQIGFIIFLPFLLVDIVVAAILMSMGMLMVPPMMISLPVKLLLFVLIDGWHLITKALIGSFS